MVHPDDRAGMIAEMEAFRDSGETTFESVKTPLSSDRITVETAPPSSV